MKFKAGADNRAAAGNVGNQNLTGAAETKKEAAETPPPSDSNGNTMLAVLTKLNAASRHCSASQRKVVICVWCPRSPHAARSPKFARTSGTGTGAAFDWPRELMAVWCVAARQTIGHSMRSSACRWGYCSSASRRRFLLIVRIGDDY